MSDTSHPRPSCCRAAPAVCTLKPPPPPPFPSRDLKAENVLRAPSGRWVLCDFGSCSARHGVLESARDIALEEEVVRKYTTPAYRAPEVRLAGGLLPAGPGRYGRPGAGGWHFGLLHQQGGVPGWVHAGCLAQKHG